MTQRWTIGLMLLTFFLTGCEEEKLPVEYGERMGNSVNGTAVFSTLCEKAGYLVQTRRQLGPELKRTADVIVWFPDDYDPPSAKHQKWFDEWLQASSGRTLVIVGRDFEAQELYWAEVNARGLTTNKTLAKSHWDNAITQLKQEYASQTMPHDGGWYKKNTPTAQGLVTGFGGTWKGLFNPAAAQIESHSTMSKSSSNPTTTLLSETAPNKNSILVFAEQLSANWNSAVSTSVSQRITVANGSFLLNYPLVNKEHRKLAAALINQIASVSPGKNMIFLESGPGGPLIREHESLAKFQTGLEYFSLPPLGTFLCHLALLGILFCFVRWPIFGRPKEPPRQTGVDFGLHLDALASLLQRTGDSKYARLRLEQYQRSLQQK